MFSMRDAAMVAGLLCAGSALVVLMGLSAWRKRWGKVALVLLCVACVAILIPAAKRARAHWRAYGVTSFVRASIDRLNTGQLPELSDKCTDGVVRGIEALKGTGLPTNYTVENIQFAGTMCTLDLRTGQGEPFWCMVEVGATGGFRLLELAPPEPAERE